MAVKLNFWTIHQILLVICVITFTVRIVSGTDTFRYTAETVSFKSNGTKITGKIFIPEGKSNLIPAVTIIGPISYVKEQSPLQYATRLAKAGYIALIWDARYFGESEGEPRQFEDPMSKVQDVKASVDYLQQRSDVDKSRIAGVGICQGANWMIITGNEDPRLKVIGLVTGSYLYPEHIRDYFNGKPPTLEERLARGRAAKEKFQKTGQVDYKKLFDARDTDVAVPVPEAYIYYYQKWENNSSWQNRYTTMTNIVTWSFDIDTYGKRLKTPVLFVHGDYSDGGFKTVQHMFDEVPQNESKQLALYEKTAHTEFYENPVVIDRAVADIVEYFQKYLA